MAKNRKKSQTLSMTGHFFTASRGIQFRVLLAGGAARSTRALGILARGGEFRFAESQTPKNGVCANQPKSQISRRPKPCRSTKISAKSSGLFPGSRMCWKCGRSIIRHQTVKRVRTHIFVASLAFLLDRALEKKLRWAGIDLSSAQA
jgi:hypothetical protein